MRVIEIEGGGWPRRGPASGRAIYPLPGQCEIRIRVRAAGVSRPDLLKLMVKGATLTGSTLRRRPANEKARLTAAVRATAWPWVVSGAVRPPIEATFPLDQAGLAHLRLEAGEHIGKIVLVVGSSNER